MAGKTLYDKIWDAHLVSEPQGGEDGDAILYIDLHLIHEVTTPQAFAGLRAAHRPVRRPDRTLAVADHNIPTENQALGVDKVADEEARLQLQTLGRNVAEYGIEYFQMGDIRNGIVHVVGPEQGRTQPGMTIVCGDSHTSTHGAFGALAHGIGTSEVEHVLATQTLRAKKARNFRVNIEGQPAPGVGAKDFALAVIRAIGTAGGTGSGEIPCDYCPLPIFQAACSRTRTLVNRTSRRTGRPLVASVKRSRRTKETRKPPSWGVMLTSVISTASSLAVSR
jgi:3-isopropylmalate/(R)-2-methylmalate dehydratase large subunit